MTKDILMKNTSSDLLSSIWSLWTSKKISRAERVILEACLVTCLDHGKEPPSAVVTRTVASCGKSLADSVAAGILTFGPRHGNAAGAASRWLRDTLGSRILLKDIVEESISQKFRIPGFGHPVYEVDPRAVALAKIVRKQLKKTPHLDFAERVSKELEVQKGKPVPLNVDGALGAIVADLKLPSEFADAIFIAARTCGLLAHAMDEMRTAKTYRRG